MYFCPICNNSFDVTKLSHQKGGTHTESNDDSEKNILNGGQPFNYQNIIKKIISKENISEEEINKINFTDLLNDPSYKKLKNKQKEFVYNKIQDLLPVNKKKIIDEEIKKPIDKSYFICRSCGHIKPIEPETLIFSRVSSDISQNYTSTDYGDMKYSDILFRTRRYECPNKKCTSYTNPIEREAVFFRRNNTFVIKYVCQACGETF